MDKAEMARGENFAAALYSLVQTHAPSDMTREDRDQMADHLLGHAVEWVRSARRNKASDAKRFSDEVAEGNAHG